MAAAPSVPAIVKPVAMYEALDPIWPDLEAGDLRRAKVRFNLLKGVSASLQSAVTKLFEEIEKTPKLADAAGLAVRHDYRSRIREIVNQQEREKFLSFLPPVLLWQKALPHLSAFTNRTQSHADLYFPETTDTTPRRLFYTQYFKAVDRFYRTAEPKELSNVIFSHFNTIVITPSAKRTVNKSEKLRIGEIGFRKAERDLEPWYYNFHRCLQHSHSAQLKRSLWDDAHPKIQELALAGYGHLSALANIFADFGCLAGVQRLDPKDPRLLLAIPDDNRLTISFNQDHINLMFQSIRNQLGPKYEHRALRKLRDLHNSTEILVNKVVREIAQGNNRYERLYRPIFDHPDFVTVLNECHFSPKTRGFFIKQEEWFRDFPHFYRAMQQRIDQSLVLIISKLQTLLDFHTWLHSEQPQEWQMENQTFDKLLASLPDRIKRITVEDSMTISTRIVEAGEEEYRKYLLEQLQTYRDFHSAFNGICSLYEANLTKTQQLRSVANLSDERVWHEVEPATHYKSIKLPIGVIVDVTLIARDLGLIPGKKQFDFCGLMRRTDLPLLKAISPYCPPKIIDLCFEKLRNIRDAESVIVFTNEVAPLHAPSDLPDEAEIKVGVDAPAKPAGTVTEPPIYRIRTTLLKKTAELLRKKSVLGVAEAIKHAETRIRDFCAISYAFEQRLSLGAMTRAEVFHRCVSIVESIDLIFEQLLHAVHRQAHPVKHRDELLLSHRTRELLEKNPDLAAALTADHYRVLMDIDYAGVDTRDIAFLVEEGRIHTPSQKLLLQVYQHHRNPASTPSLVADLQLYCIEAFRVSLALVDYLAKPKTATRQSKEFLELTQQWDLVGKQKELASTPSPLHTTPLQEEALKDLSALEHFINELRRPELLGEEDCDQIFDNLLYNRSSRLRTAIENQSILNPDELSAHLATVLTLTHLIAEDILYLHLLVLEKNGYAIAIPKDRKIRALVKAHKGKKLPPELATFVNTPLRNIARYAESFDHEKVDTKTAAAAKRMQRAIRSSAAASPAAPTPAKTAPAEGMEGFTTVDFRVVRETHEDAAKAIHLLRDLIAFVCVSPKK